METFGKQSKNSKRKIKKIVSVILLCISFVLASIQDLSFSKYLEMLRTPFPVLLSLFVFYFLLNFLRRNRIYITYIEKLFFKYVLYLLFVTFISLFLYVLTKGEFYLLGKNILLKGIITISYYVVFAFAIIYFRMLYEILGYSYVFYSLSFIHLFLFFVFLLELKYYPYFSLFHTEEPYYRIRLFTHESSWAGSLMLVFYFLSLFSYSKIKEHSAIGKTVILLVTLYYLIFLIFSASKGLYVCLILGLLISFLFYIKNNITSTFIGFRINPKTFSSIFIICIIILLIYFYILPKLIIEITVDIENFTSFSTRSTLILSALKLFIENPFGYGTSVFYPKLLETLEQIIRHSTLILGYNIVELLSYFNSYKGLAIKSFFFQHLVFGGLIFFIFFLLIIKNGYSFIQKESFAIRWLYIAIILTLVIYMNLDIKYQYAAFFGILSYEGRIKRS